MTKMKKDSFSLPRTAAVFASLAFVAATGSSCTTSYDAYGRPRQTVDPALAVAGIAAAGLIGYAIANNSDHRGGNYGDHYAHGGGGRGGHHYDQGRRCY